MGEKANIQRIARFNINPAQKISLFYGLLDLALEANQTQK